MLSAALYAVTDEIHQLFVPGRSGQITDVILDSCGGLIGAVLSATILYLIRKRKKDGS
ncbi:MAG: VanZ family protein [Coprococcus sp.]